MYNIRKVFFNIKQFGGERGNVGDRAAYQRLFIKRNEPPISRSLPLLMKVVEAMEDGTIAGAEGPKRINLPSNAFARADPITRKALTHVKPRPVNLPQPI